MSLSVGVGVKKVLKGVIQKQMALWVSPGWCKNV